MRPLASGLASGKRSLGCGRVGRKRRCPQQSVHQGSHRDGVPQAVHFMAGGVGQANHGDFWEQMGVGGPLSWAQPGVGSAFGRNPPPHHLSALWLHARSSVPGTCFQCLMSSS